MWQPEQYRQRPEVTFDVADRIIEEVSNGASLTALLEYDRDMPSPAAWFRWLKTEPEYAQRYEDALLARADVMLEEALELSSGGDPARARVQIEARMRAAEVINRPKFGKYSPVPPAPKDPPQRANHGDELRRKLDQMAARIAEKQKQTA